MNKLFTMVYAAFTAIGLYASYINFTDDLFQPIISLALGLGVGTHGVMLLKWMMKK